ncbi:hypothetical protein SAMN06265338_102158 [Rhodoblastus acidophilus]|uniref:Cysteine rich repeat-containing protein n=1 Tax=Rhodoblastus acidophilus TaxID=1074 RepID=A0A212QZK9_RHOAC|nr:hypothetical protein [Rhodoblastus acidophilus]PPQ40528.1 hypothetical protein CKO16_01940 [Rhodoblastus acidophilus]RAI18636.1 hypothetical protein CH337_13725 [Rhodoblastus acidophilus]SNB65154.1 hypothetical protein SAMN06265338_102158 [Rhodoblastus acidophilus]
MSIKMGAAILSLLLTGAASSAFAAGTKEQEDACRPDVRRYCHQVHPDAGDDAFLTCLQAHRAKLTPKCRNVLESNGV